MAKPAKTGTTTKKKEPAKKSTTSKTSVKKKAPAKKPAVVKKASTAKKKQPTRSNSSKTTPRARAKTKKKSGSKKGVLLLAGVLLVAVFAYLAGQNNSTQVAKVESLQDIKNSLNNLVADTRNIKLPDLSAKANTSDRQDNSRDMTAKIEPNSWQDISNHSGSNGNRPLELFSGEGFNGTYEGMLYDLII